MILLGLWILYLSEERICGNYYWIMLDNLNGDFELKVKVTILLIKIQSYYKN